MKFLFRCLHVYYTTHFLFCQVLVEISYYIFFNSIKKVSCSKSLQVYIEHDFLVACLVHLPSQATQEFLPTLAVHL